HELLDPIPIEGGKDRGEIVRAHVDDDPHLAGVFVIAYFFEKGLDEMDRQIVTAVEAEVFERGLDVAFAGAGKAGDDDQVFGAIHRAEVLLPREKVPRSGG